MLQEFEAWIAETFGLQINTVDTLARILIAAGIIAILLILRAALLRVIERNIEEVQTRHRWRRTINYLTTVIAFALASSLLVREAQSVATLLGLLGAGLAIVLRDPIVNIIAWVFIVSGQTFDIGDRIEINGQRGDVIDIQLFQFVLLELGEWVDADQSTGRVLYIPNQKVFTQPVLNYHAGIGHIWDEISMVVTFESNWEKAREIVQSITDEHKGELAKEAVKAVRGAQNRYPIVYAELKPIVYMKVLRDGIRLTVRFLCDPRKRRSVENQIWGDVLLAFAEEGDIDFAYPTTRFYQ